MLRVTSWAWSVIDRFGANEHHSDAPYLSMFVGGDEPHFVDLRAHARELKSAGVAHLRVFGSVARGEASSRSDVDLLVDFDESRRVSLVTVGRLQKRLVDLLGDQRGPSAAGWLKQPVRERARQEAVVALGAHSHRL